MWRFRCYHSFENLQHFGNSKVKSRPADTDHIWSFDTRLAETSISQSLPSSPFQWPFSSSTCTSWLPLVSFLHCCWEEPFGISGTGSSGTGCCSCYQINSVKALTGTKSSDSWSGKIINSNHRFFIYLLIHPPIHPSIHLFALKKDDRLNNKNSSGDQIANVNFYAVHPEATRIRWNNAK